jgi:uncharacterized membrane protein YgdD (TMEM256/DUF423 family)
MHSVFIKIAAVLGALGVAFGAFGAHILKQKVSEATVNIFETAVRYQFYHVIALLLVAIIYKDYNNKWTTMSGWFFIIGMLFFSGSLYLLAFIKETGKTEFNWVGAITPLGGVAFIAGWVCLFLGMMKEVR